MLGNAAESLSTMLSSMEEGDGGEVYRDPTDPTKVRRRQTGGVCGGAGDSREVYRNPTDPTING